MNGAKVILLRRLCVFKIAIGEARRTLLLRLLNVSDRARKQNARGADLAQDVSFIILSYFMISALWKLDIVPEWEGLCFHREGVEYCFGSGAECVSQPSWSQIRVVSSIKLKIRLSWKSGNVELPAAEGLLWKNGSMFSLGVVNFEFQNVREIVFRSGQRFEKFEIRTDGGSHDCRSGSFF